MPNQLYAFKQIAESSEIFRDSAPFVLRSEASRRIYYQVFFLLIGLEEEKGAILSNPSRRFAPQGERNKTNGTNPSRR
jgi:hypothetical protein